MNTWKNKLLDFPCAFLIFDLAEPFSGRQANWDQHALTMGTPISAAVGEKSKKILYIPLYSFLEGGPH